jgi:galactose oxidase
MNFQNPPLFPRLHVEPKQGRIFMSGPQQQSFFLDTIGNGNWIPGPVRDGALRDYVPSVMYESGKVLFIGGGLDPDTLLPTNRAETIDLNLANPQWQATPPMHFARRQHNATILPDGTVLVTGGTQGLPGNQKWRAFDNLDKGAPIHSAELWDPASGKWTIMAEEATDRCYHSIALLLPAGRVLSAGGGEYAPGDPAHPNQPNPSDDSHIDAQLYSPPYLMKGPRPQILVAPTEITYGQGFDVTVGKTDVIAKVSWIRLSSMTHSCNQNQLLNFLTFKQVAGKVTIQAPASANVAPPGHYMLFVMNGQGVPSIGHIARITAQAVAPAVHNAAFGLLKGDAAPGQVVDMVAIDRKMAAAAGKPPVVIGVTSTCPYGIAACWGGAFDALQHLRGIEKVRPLPDNTDSDAFVYLKEDTLPDLDVWREEFADVANGSYELRGIELTLDGRVTATNGLLTLAGNTTRPEVVLAPLQAPDKVQWDINTRANRPMSSDEENAYERLSVKLAKTAAKAKIEVVGPLKKNGKDFFLEVRTAPIDSVAV